MEAKHCANALRFELETCLDFAACRYTLRSPQVSELVPLKISSIALGLTCQINKMAFLFL